MSTKPDTDTEWSKDLSTLADGDYFSRVDEYDKWPTLIRLENGAVYEMGQGGNLRREYAAEDYEYLGPFTASDFEQLIQLRKAAQDAEKFLAWWCESTDANPPRGVRGAVATLTALREALGHTGALVRKENSREHDT